HFPLRINAFRLNSGPQFPLMLLLPCFPPISGPQFLFAILVMVSQSAHLGHPPLTVSLASPKGNCDPLYG
ncbi:hypothetical protein, partial [Paenibacillus alba]|uniref:hypothetical protein n=1 Tax=Paenibacillus alba TaxID=1197127 RepID=UPI001C207140